MRPRQRSPTVPVLAFSQGDPAGIGPEILAKLALSAPEPAASYRPLWVAERAAFQPLAAVLPHLGWERISTFSSPPSREALENLDPRAVAHFDPVADPRAVVPGAPGPADAAGALAALDAAAALVRAGVADALITAPLSKAVIDRHHLPGFTGHTDYLAAAAGLEVYGRDYLMAFLAPTLQVALLSTHVPLVEAIRQVEPGSLLAALTCLDRHAGGKIAVAGLNPHAGEGGLLGAEEGTHVLPAVAAARELGIDAHGPESADSLFARAAGGEFDWVLALYHDQGLIAVKTAAFGLATNWTLGLPYLRTSVDHGTAFAIAGKGVADEKPLAACVETTLRILAGTLPHRRASATA